MEIQRLVRVNGLTWPLDKSQVAVWVVYAFSIFVFFYQQLFEFKQNLKIVYGVIYVTLMVLLVVHLIMITYRDPTDPVVKTYKRSENHV